MKTLLRSLATLCPRATASYLAFILAFIATLGAGPGVWAATYTPTILTDPAVTGGVNSATGVITGGAGAGQVSLRSAVIAANAAGGTNTITLGAGTYQLTIAGTGETASSGDATIGDLDILAPASGRNTLTVQGTGAASTTIQQTSGIDRIFDVHPVNLAGSVTFNLSDVTLKGGNLIASSGGAILAGRAGDVTSVSNSVFDGNSAPNSGAISQSSSLTAHDLIITNCSFTNNTATSGGPGAVNYNGVGTVNITGCTFSGNTAATQAGAINITGGGTGPVTVNILRNAFLNNTANGSQFGGAAVAVVNAQTININFNRLVGNTSPNLNTGLTPNFGDGRVITAAGGTITTFNTDSNWWGVNSGPVTTAGSRSLFGTSATQWLQLRNSASPTTVNVAGTSTVGADLFGLNTGGATSAANLTGLSAFPTSGSAFGNAQRGTIPVGNVQFINGAASVVFTGTTAGPGGVDATADSQAITAPITVNPAPTTITSLNRVNATPSNASTVNWTLTFAAANTGVTASNFSLGGAAATGSSVGTPTTSDGGINWNVPVTTGSTDGTLTLSLANATGTTPGVSNSLPFAGQSYTMDKTRPTVSIGAPSSGSVSTGGSASFLVTYTDTNFNSSTLANGNITLNTTGGASGTIGVTGSGNTRTVTISSVTGAGTIGITVAASTASDTAGNTNLISSPSGTFTVTAPAATGTPNLIVHDGATTGAAVLNPTFAWSPTTTTGAPAARQAHTAVFTGVTGNAATANRTLLWGGTDGANLPTNTGGLYHPATDSWTATGTAGAPSLRTNHTAVWTGATGNASTANRMIIWGGDNNGATVFNTGGRYDPASNTWAATNTAGAPVGRSYHLAVWTGNTGNAATANRMIVFGGGDSNFANLLNTGGIYDPATDSWTATTTTNAPSARYFGTAIWTGNTGNAATANKMIVFGGESLTAVLNDGGIYDPATNTWTTLPANAAIGDRGQQTAVWTGSKMILFGGENAAYGVNAAIGATYDFAANTWTALPTTGAPAGRIGHSAVWTGDRMLVFGGYIAAGSARPNDTTAYDPVGNTWSTLSNTNAPAGRFQGTGTWGSSSMVVLHGNTTAVSNTGGVLSGTRTSALGSQAVGSPLVKSFNIDNTGNGDLTGITVTFTGTNAADFSTNSIPSTVAAGTNSAMTINFTPGASGARSATMTIASNDPNRSPYVVNLTGSGAAALSNNADLSALALTTATINEAFAAATTSYTSSVPNATSSVTVTPTAAQANATIQARVGANAFATVTSGSPSASLPLAVGPNTIDVKVTAQDGTTIKTYTITVTRAAAFVSAIYDFENLSGDGATTFSSSGQTWTLTGFMIGHEPPGVSAGLGAPLTGIASPGSDGYMDTVFGQTRGFVNVGGIKAPVGFTFRASSFDVWPSSNTGAQVYGSTGNGDGQLGTVGLNYQVVGKLGGSIVATANVTDTARTPAQTGTASGGFWHHIELGATFAATDIDTVEFVLVAQTGVAMNYLAVDNFAYSNLTNGGGGGVAPVVTLNPTSQSVVSGQSVSFSAGASGTPTPTVQWQVSTDGGLNFGDIGGQTGTTLTFTPVVADNAKQYRARFSNATASNVPTTAATLTVNKASTTTALTTSGTPSLFGANVTFTATVTPTLPGTGTPSGTVNFSVDGGAAIPMPLSGGVASFSTTTLTPGNHTIDASYAGDANFNTSNATQLAQAVNKAPAITGNPVSQLINVGGNVSFVAMADGFPVPTAQWQVDSGGGFANLSNGGAVSGATTGTLTITGVTFALNGNKYRAVFTNVVNTATTTPATLTVNRPPVPGVVTAVRYPTQPVKIPVATITGAATDLDPGDTISLVSVANGTNGTALISGNYVFYTPTGNFPLSHTFNYTIQDNHGATAIGTVTVNVVVDNAAGQNIIRLVRLPDGTAVVSFAGIPSLTYGVQYKTLLSDPTWTNLGPVTVDAFGAATYTDSDPVHKAAATGFYRFIYPAP